MLQKNNFNFKYFSSNLFIVIGLVSVWRGVWYILDGIDIWFLGGNHYFTAIGGVIFGLLILYVPDKDLKEIGKL
jgi:membrane associated rhomboid family serine protease